MSKITVLNEKAIAVEVPGHIEKIVWEKGNEGKVLWMFSRKNQLKDHKRIRLPEDSWSILGRPEEMAEEQWHKIVDRFNNGACRDYKCPQFDPCDELLPMHLTATDSGISLLKSKGLNPSNTLILIKQ